ncbi:MAG: sigma-70 family RNA polymerase sigma factor [Clostridia bacterium]|nr:sigma-70 family RNA polymerase sigma factor [Clostridia bacterium]
MDEDRFVASVENLTNTLYRICRSILPCDADCMDAVQSAVLKAWINIHTLRDENLFDRWLIRIAINECRKLLRKNRPLVPLTEDLPARDTDRAWEILHALDEKYRLPAELYYVENYKTSEIARILRLPEGTVKRRLHTARKLLKEGGL